MANESERAKSFRVEVQLPENVRPQVNQLIGLYGERESDVVRALVLFGLDQVRRAKLHLERKKQRKELQLR